MQNIEYYLAGGGLRLFQVVIYASLWIVIGCLIAAVFRRMLGEEKVRRLFADGTRWGLLTGWLIGMLLPVCSLGVIPIVSELHRARVRTGTIVAFGLTAPLFNPMSVLYGLTLSDPIAILSFSLCALVIVSFLGMVWNWQSEAVVEKKPSEPLPAVGLKRMFAVFYTAAKELVGPSLVYILIGIAGSVVVSTLLPKGYLQNQIDHDNVFAPVVVASIATPIYSTPLLAMSQIGGMFQHGNSIGGAFSLLILGAGANLGLLFWFGATYGKLRALMFYGLLFITTIGLAYIIDKPLYPKGVDPAGHSHAFDVYSNPFEARQPNLFETAEFKAVDFWKSNEFGGTYLLGFLMISGVVLVVAERFVNLESWFLSSESDELKNDMIVPSWVLGLTVVVGLVASSVVGCYLYYPAPNDLLADLSIVNTEAVLSARTKDWEAAEKWIGFSDDLSRRLEVGVFLRNGSVGDFQSTKAKLYREKLDVLKMAVETKNADRVEELSMDVSRAYLRMSSAFRDEKPNPDLDRMSPATQPN